MSTYSLSGSGVQLLTADTTALHVSITTLSPFGGIGHANPPNHYHQALLRPGDGTGYWAPVPVEGGPQWIGLPNGTDRIGYACEGGAAISVVEVIGGTSPFAGPPGSPGAAGPAGPPGASGALSHSYVGYNTVGGTWQNMANQLMVAKTISTASDGLLSSIGAYVKGGSGAVATLFGAVLADNSGAPGKLLSVLPGTGGNLSIYLSAVGGWLHLPMGVWLPAGTYWLCVQRQDGNTAAGMQIAFDAGNDKTAPPGGYWLADGPNVVWSTSANKYSIRGSLLA